MGVSVNRGFQRSRDAPGHSAKDWLSVVSVVVVSASLTGCATEQTESDDPVFTELIETAIEDAEAGGAGVQQLAILEDARESGEVTLEQMREATRATIECFLDAGLGAEYLEGTEPHGLILPEYSVWVEGEFSESDMRAMDQCDSENGFWVNMVYQVQPASDQLWFGYYDSKADEFRSCLEDSGYRTDPDATGVELVDQVGAVFSETGGEVDCWDSVVDR